MSKKPDIICQGCPFNGLDKSQREIVETEYSWGISPREQVERDMLDGVPPAEAFANLDYMYRLEYPTIQTLMQCVGRRASERCLESNSQ